MGVSVVACPTPVLQFFDNAGRPAAGGSVLTQVGGVNYPTYADSGGTIPLPNPIPLNSRGEVSTASGVTSQLFLAASTIYTFTLSDKNGNQLNQATYVAGTGSSSAISAAVVTQSFTATANQTVFTLSSPANAGNLIVVSLNGVLMIPGTDYNVTGAGVITLTNGAMAGQTLYVASSVVIPNVNSQVFAGAPSDLANVHFTRNASYTGGTPGNTLAALRVDDNVSAGVANFEWGFLSVLNNSATGGQNVAIYGQGNRQTNTTGPTWAGVMEVRETVALNDPTAGLIGLEVDNRSNGTDANFNRVGIDVVCARYNTGGAATTVSWGVRVQAGNDANVTVTQGFAVWDCKVGVAFDCGNALSILSGSLRMPQGVPILFDISGTPQKLLSQGLGLDHFGTAGTLVNRLLNAGGLQVGTSQVVGARINGYGTPTGAANQGSFASGSISLANLAAGVAQLILDLKTHGLLGT